MTKINSNEQKRGRGHDGAMLDVAVRKGEELPHGLVRLPSGILVVTQAFCPNGHNLVSDKSPARFNSYPGIIIAVQGQAVSGNVILSPIHGDDTKFGVSDFEPGELTTLTCPECGIELPVIQPCGCQSESKLFGIFLDEERSEGNQVAICNCWGCVRSRVMDRFQIISKYE